VTVKIDPQGETDFVHGGSVTRHQAAGEEKRRTVTNRSHTETRAREEGDAMLGTRSSFWTRRRRRDKAEKIGKRPRLHFPPIT